MIRPLLLLCLALAGCGLPRDTEGTLERVRVERSFRVGLVATGEAKPAVAEAEALLRRLSASTGATPRLEAGAAEPLLARLEAGELDLVIGRFVDRSPWEKRVSIAPAVQSSISGAGARSHQLAAATRHGENAWIALVHRASRAVAGGAR